jgi:hypothetical protein
MALLCNSAWESFSPACVHAFSATGRFPRLMAS